MATPHQHPDSVQFLNDQRLSPDPRYYHGWQHSTANDGTGYNEGYVVSPVSEYPQDAVGTMNNSPNQQFIQEHPPNSKEHLQLVQEHPFPQYQQHPTTYRSNSWRKSWGVETASTIFSMLCVVAMVIILSRIDGRLLSSWTIEVSPNAVISVLSTASKAAMILPVAEGLSQLKWLYLERQGLRQVRSVFLDCTNANAMRSCSLDHLQTFDDASRGPWGALKFFLFARKATFIAYVGCIVTIAAIALEPFTQQILSYGSIPTQVPGIHSIITRSQAYDNQGKGLNGVANVMSSTRDGPLQAAAISGLYDLIPAPPFTCPGSNCTYPLFTSLGIQNQCRDVTDQTVQNCISTNHSQPIQLCNYTLPGGAKLESYASVDAHNGFGHTAINITVNTTSPVPNAPILTNIGIITFGNRDDEPDFEVTTSWQKTLTAYECSYEVSALAYSNWTSVNGTVYPGKLQMSALNITGMGPIFPMQALDDTFPGNRTFELNYYDLNYMAVCLKIFNSDETGQFSSYSKALYNSPNLTQTMENIATGMSYRMLSGPNATAVEGEVFAVQTYIHVHWAWLALTVSLLVIACLFFLAVMIQTQTAHQRAWKSSLAPLLYDTPASAVDKHGRPDWPENFKHISWFLTQALSTAPSTMVAFQILSDLHFEAANHYDEFHIPPRAPYLALLGDIGNFEKHEARYTAFLRRQLARFRAVLLVLGNHEQHRSNWYFVKKTLERLQAAVQERRQRGEALGEFVLLDQTRYDIDVDGDGDGEGPAGGERVTVLGCTLFSHIPPKAKKAVSKRVGDFRCIRAWDCDLHNAAHASDLQWLNAQIQALQGSGHKAVVLTHYSPTIDDRAVEPRYRCNAVRSNYATDLRLHPVWQSEVVKLWSFGHTHFNCDFMDQTGKRVYTNQRGRTGCLKGFDVDMTVEV